jgi:hypothetical protein
MEPFLPPELARFLGAYPAWLVLLCAIVALAAALWVLGKLLKWGLWLVLIAILAGGSALLLRELLR